MSLSKKSGLLFAALAVVLYLSTFILKTAVEYIPANKNQHKLDKKN
jgi:hypothetical protein